eukprot:COSAG02_NODE_442_length_22243_cov_20.572887_21_plen_67_part_00
MSSACTSTRLLVYIVPGARVDVRARRAASARRAARAAADAGATTTDTTLWTFDADNAFAWVGLGLS